ncbi:transposable element Tcb2 transposase [Trichonephila clavipes]|nr:transposable element Tcb2 transposase [Trichonephila clavipes]
MRWRIMEKLEAGQCQVQICIEFSLTPCVVCNLWKQLQDTGSIEGRLGQGRSRSTTAREVRHLEPGTHYLPSNVHEIDNYGVGGLMVWTGIILDGRTPLHVFERGSVTVVRYRDEVLEPYVTFSRMHVVRVHFNGRYHETT